MPTRRRRRSSSNPESRSSRSGRCRCRKRDICLRLWASSHLRKPLSPGFALASRGTRKLFCALLVRTAKPSPCRHALPSKVMAHREGREHSFASMFPNRIFRPFTYDEHCIYIHTSTYSYKYNIPLNFSSRILFCHFFRFFSAGCRATISRFLGI